MRSGSWRFRASGQRHAYHRTILGYHGTRRRTAERLVAGDAFGPSTNDDDWLGHGIYFWEYAPQQAWRWARQRYGDGDAAVVGAMIRLGRCLDLLDPGNFATVREAHAKLEATLAALGKALPANMNKHKFLDCAIFNDLFGAFEDAGRRFETCRAVFVPQGKRGIVRLWPRSGIFESGHIQVSIREPRNILAVWSVRRDGRYGKDE